MKFNFVIYILLIDCIEYDVSQEVASGRGTKASSFKYKTISQTSGVISAISFRMLFLSIEVMVGLLVYTFFS